MAGASGPESGSGKEIVDGFPTKGFMKEAHDNAVGLSRTSDGIEARNNYRWVKVHVILDEGRGRIASGMSYVGFMTGLTSQSFCPIVDEAVFHASFIARDVT